MIVLNLLLENVSPRILENICTDILWASTSDWELNGFLESIFKVLFDTQVNTVLTVKVISKEKSQK